MGDNFFNNRMGHKSSNGRYYSVNSYDHWTGNIVTKRPNRKMQAKLIAFITLDLLGITWIAKSLFEKIDSVKELLVFVIVLCYAIGRFYIRLRRDQVLLKKEMFEQMEREAKFKKEYNR